MSARTGWAGKQDSPTNSYNEDLESSVKEEEEDLKQPPLARFWEYFLFGMLVAGIAAWIVVLVADPFQLTWWNRAPTRSAANLEYRPPSVLPPVVSIPPFSSSTPSPQESGTASPLTAPMTPQAEKSVSAPLLAAKPEAATALAAPPVTSETPKPIVTAPTSVGPAAAEPKNRAPTGAKEKFWVQVAAFRDSKTAARLAARLQTEHYPVLTRQEQLAGALYAVWVGSYSNRQQAEAVRADLERKGFPGFILKREE